MIFRSTLLVFAGLAFAFALAAQGNTPPGASLKLPNSAKAGKSVSGTVEVTFAVGLHGYQNPPSTPDLIPLVVSSDTKDVKVTGVKYPVGKSEKVIGSEKPVKVYEGTIKIPVTLSLPKKHGKVKVQLKVSYQQCNAQSCFPPADVETSATVTLK